MDLYKEEIKLTVTTDGEKMSFSARAGWSIIIGFGIVVSIAWMVLAGAIILSAVALIIGSPIAVLAGHGSSLEHRVAEIDLVVCALLALVMLRLWANDPH